VAEYIYVIMRHTGDYEDARSETVCACRTRKEAATLAARMTTAAVAVYERGRNLADIYFAEVADNVETPADRAYQAWSATNGTALDREWQRELEVPTYAVHRSAIRKVSTGDVTNDVQDSIFRTEKQGVLEED